jgi:hypothetical protein
MTAANEWTGVTTKTIQSTFVANPSSTQRKLTSWNCGVKGHAIKDCPKPGNLALQERNQKPLKKQRK